MFDWDAALQQVDFECLDAPVDHGFIVDFLQRYFPDRGPEELGARLSEVIKAEGARALRAKVAE